MQYFVTNEVRRQSTRVARARSAVRAKFTQRICGNTLRLVRGKHRGAVLTEEQFSKYHSELREKQSKGLIAVRTGGFTGPLVEFTEYTAPRAEVEDTKKEIPIPEEVSIQSTDKPPDKMSKSELVHYASQVLGQPVEDLEILTKRQILERLK